MRRRGRHSQAVTIACMKKERFSFGKFYCRFLTIRNFVVSAAISGEKSLKKAIGAGDKTFSPH